MTIADVAAKVVREHGSPMTIDEIYSAIMAQRLFEFKSNQARQVLRTQIRRHCANVQSPAASDRKLFVFISPDKYGLS